MTLWRRAEDGESQTLDTELFILLELVLLRSDLHCALVLPLEVRKQLFGFDLSGALS